jgi:hypothetical protein
MLMITDCPSEIVGKVSIEERVVVDVIGIELFEVLVLLGEDVEVEERDVDERGVDERDVDETEEDVRSSLGS